MGTIFKTWPIACPETSVNYHNSLYNNPEEWSSHLLRCGSLKSCKVPLPYMYIYIYKYTHTHTQRGYKLHIYIYMFVCMCVCVCVYLLLDCIRNQSQSHFKIAKIIYEDFLFTEAKIIWKYRYWGNEHKVCTAKPRYSATGRSPQFVAAYQMWPRI